MISAPELWKVISGVSTDMNLEVITEREQNNLPAHAEITSEHKKAKRKSLFDKAKEAAKQIRERKAAEQKMKEEQADNQQKKEAQIAEQKRREAEKKSLNNSGTLSNEANEKKKTSEQQKENNSVVIYEFQNCNSNGEKSPQSWIVRIPKLPWTGVGSFEIYREEVKKCFGRTITAPGISCTRVILPEGIEVIPSDAFTPNFCKGMYYYPYKEGFQFLEVVILPESVREISASAFNGCKTVKRVEMPNGVNSIGFGAFENSGVEYITIPDGVSKIVERTFKRV
jgi:hypothetical protein